MTTSTCCNALNAATTISHYLTAICEIKCRQPYLTTGITMLQKVLAKKHNLAVGELPFALQLAMTAV